MKKLIAILTLFYSLTALGQNGVKGDYFILLNNKVTDRLRTSCSNYNNPVFLLPMKRGDLKNQQAMYRLLDKWESSGQNQKAFCRSEGLNYFTFKYWKSKRASQVGNASNHLKDIKPGFIPIQVS